MEDYELDFEASEYETRRILFEERKKEVMIHNRNPARTWSKALNKFSVYTETELKSFRSGRIAPEHTKNYATDPALFETPKAKVSVDWRTKGCITPVKNQAMCGSCWSFGSAETLESYWFLKTGNLVVLSEQQILDCTPNPNDCGGTGGCGGGTVELAYAQIQVMGGLTSEENYPYVSGGGQNQACQNASLAPIAKISGFVNLPVNKYEPVINYLAQSGPLAINVDASSWSSYGSGVFNGCNQATPDIDHVVQLVGAGTDPNYGDYWIVRNSWGAGWGEEGYIRLARSATPECGVDITPGDGTGCNGGPANVTVCGTCGILFDALYPTVQV